MRNRPMLALVNPHAGPWPVHCPEASKDKGISAKQLDQKQAGALKKADAFTVREMAKPN